MTVKNESNLNNIKIKLVSRKYIEMFHRLLRVYSFLYSFLYFCIFLKTTMEKWNKICKGT
ncbi:hypothetical protein FC697_16675 [Bacillus wiedmannii]|nr:hypothetical protein FC697_16675 [Bacillus wiedmannii]